MIHRANRAGRGRWPLLAGGLALLAACSLEVVNPGAITDESLNDPDLMDRVAAGVANEFTNEVNGVAWDILRLSDEAAGTGSYFETGQLREGELTWDDTNGDWAQFHEALWTGRSAWGRMTSVEPYDEDSSSDAARIWLLMGLTHRFYGETFCQVVYSVGPDPEEPVFGGVLPRTAAFDSAVVSLNRAITIGTAAEEDDMVTAARAGLAQAYAAMGDFATAVTHSVQVPTDFVYEAIFNINSIDNTVWEETIGRAEIGLYNSYVQRHLAEDNPRVPYTICGTFDNPADPFNSDVTGTAADCESEQGADGVTAHYQQEKFPEEGSDVSVASGVEMRLIEAEEALGRDDMATFKARIDAVRAHYGLGPLTAEPAAAGALEFPNVYDASTGSVTGTGVDAWSILDAERHLTLWGEGRRLWDLHRWNHPYLDGGFVFHPTTNPRRVSCFPVPHDECTLNPALNGAELLTGVGDGSRACS